MKKNTKHDGFYLGRRIDSDEPLFYESKNLTTHAMIVGMTGSGKTGLGIDLLEEAALSGIPALIIDPKGEMANLCLAFEKLKADSFLPWVDNSQDAESVAKSWKDGLSKWKLDEQKIQKFNDAVDITIYTPASFAGVPLSILHSFDAPPDEIIQDREALQDRIATITSSLLGLIGIHADPLTDPEHILLATLFERAWRKKENLDLEELIQQIQRPPFDKIGALATETFFPERERIHLSMRLNSLLASPSFQTWVQGEPLDIESLLYTQEGKPRFAIFSIAHLQDSERMFFVTLLLNQVLDWMRSQSGTTNLRALLYMDEIFGYFPATMMPPSKTPMLTLLKQGRGYGLGVVLATQNPVDLDYKGLANCGTWFIGKLQTDRDRAKVLQGLDEAQNVKAKLAKCAKRIFLMHSIYEKEPVLFETRWTLSYLKGPLTLSQIQILMQDRVKVGETKKLKTTKPFVPVPELYMPSRHEHEVYKAKILGIAKLHFVDAKRKIDTWKEIALLADATDTGTEWSLAEDVSTEKQMFLKQSAPDAKFEELPSALMQAKNYSSFSKELQQYLYQNKTFDLMQAKDANMISEIGESEQDFRQRVSHALREKSDETLKRIRDRYEKQFKVLKDKIQKAGEKAQVQKSQFFRQITDTVISATSTIIGFFMGRGPSKESVYQAGTSMRKASKIGQEKREEERSREVLSALEKELTDLQEKMENEIREQSGVEPSKVVIEKTVIRPRKSDIDVESVSLVWCPN